MAIDPFEEFRRKQAAKTPLVKPTLSIKPKAESVPIPRAIENDPQQEPSEAPAPGKTSNFTSDRHKKMDKSSQSVARSANIDEHRVPKQKLGDVDKPDNLQKY